MSSPAAPAQLPAVKTATPARTVVHKFGGTSVADAERYRHVAQLLLAREESLQVTVVSAMKGLASEPGIGRMGADQIRSRFDRRLYTSYVESVKANNVRITTQGGPQIRVRYEVRRPMFGNLDFIATFDRTEKLSTGGE